MKNLIFFIIYILFNLRLIKIALDGIYLPIYSQFEWLAKYKIKTIIDVGAYKGEVSQSIHYIFPKSKVYAFEPNNKNHKSIESKISKANLVLLDLALSNKSGKSKFYRYDNHPALSSILSVQDLFKKTYKVNPIAKLQKVNTTTLDKYFNRKKLNQDILLKIDTQGSESMIIEGGRKFIRKVSIIIIEVSFEKYYKDQKLFTDIYKQLLSLGFEFRGEARESEFYPTFGLRDQVNVVFVNKRLL